MTLPQLSTNGRFIVDPNGNNVILRGVVTINMGQIYGPKAGPSWFGLTIGQYIAQFTNWNETTQTGWVPKVVRMLFNDWPSSAADQENSRDIQNPPAYFVPFSYNQATLPAAWVANHNYTAGDQMYVPAVGPNGRQVVFQAGNAGVSAATVPTLVNGNGDGTTTDNQIKWTAINPTVITDADWIDWCSKVLFPSVDGAIAKGLYVIITLNDFGDPVINPTMEDRHASFWSRMSSASDIAGAKYRNNPAVLFENHGEIVRSGAGVWAGIKPLFQKTLDMVRANGANNIFITSTPGYCGSPVDAQSIPLTGGNIAYAYHAYAFNTPIDMAYAKSQLAGSLPIVITEWGDDSVLYLFYQTYPLGQVISVGGVWYECVKSDIQGTTPVWATSSYAVGQKVWSDGAVWECTVAGTSTTAPTGNSFNNPDGMDNVHPDGTATGLAHWKCDSCRDRTPVTSPAFWAVTTRRSLWYQDFLNTIEPSLGSTNPPAGATAWAVGSDWAPPLFTDNSLTTTTGWGEEARSWLASERNANQPSAGTVVVPPPVIVVPPVVTSLAPVLDVITTPTSAEPIVLTGHIVLPVVAPTLVSLTVSPTSISNTVGGTVKLVVTGIFSDKSTSSVPVIFSSSNLTVATVTATGLVASIGSGTAVITVTSGTVTATVAVTVSMSNSQDVAAAQVALNSALASLNTATTAVTSAQLALSKIVLP